MERKLRLEPRRGGRAGARGGRATRAERVDEVEFSAEDATRSDPAFVAEVCRAAIEAGATTINLPDTVGYCLPDEYAAFLRRGPGALPRARAASTLSVHCHDDLGLAVANTLAGVARGRDPGRVHRQRDRRAGRQRGARGDRDGAARPRRRARAPRPASTSARSARASALVSRLTGYAVQRNKAIVGANAFAHEAGIHQDGMLKDAATYQIIDPTELGLTMTLPLGKHSGRHAFARACADAGHRARRRRAATRRSRASSGSPTSARP